MNIDNILNLLKQEFPSLDLRYEKIGDSIKFLSGERNLGISLKFGNSLSGDDEAQEKATAEVVLNAIRRVQSGKLVNNRTKSEPVPFKEEKKEEKVEEKKEKFEVSIPEILEPAVVEAVEPPTIDTVKKSATKKKSSSKKKKTEA